MRKITLPEVTLTLPEVVQLLQALGFDVSEGQLIDILNQMSDGERIDLPRTQLGRPLGAKDKRKRRRPTLEQLMAKRSKTKEPMDELMDAALEGAQDQTAPATTDETEEHPF